MSAKVPAGRTIVVTGGAGYIGAHVCKALDAAGFSPVSLDNLTTGHSENVLWGPLEREDIRHQMGVEKVLMKYAPLAVIHLAGSLSVGESVQDPAKYYDNNVVGSMRLLDACRRVGIEHFIFSSSAAVYGNSPWNLIDESHPCTPINPYGFSKWTVEQMLKDYGAAYGINSLSLRYFNAAGADKEKQVGYRGREASNLIPILLQLQSEQREQFSLFGADYPTRDGTAERDYIHVSDLARAHVLALEYLIQGGASDSLNLGTGRGYTVLEVIESVERVTRKKVTYRREGRRRGDPPILLANAQRAQSVLGWSPSSSSLDEIVASAWAFHCQLLL